MSSTTIHALVVLAVVTAATVLRALNCLDVQETGFVYATALGFAAGRSGTIPPSPRDPNG